MFKNLKYKKWLAGIFLALFLFITGFSALTYPQKADAFPAEVTFTVETIFQRITNFIYNSLVTALLRAGMNTAQFIVQKLAHDAAVWIASGGAGQSPLVEQRGAAEYWQDFGAQIAGDLIGNLNDDFGKYYNLCNPPSPQLRLQFKLGLLQEIKPGKPKCDFYDIKKNWDKMAEETKANFLNQFQPKEFLGMIQRSFEPGGNDIGMFMSITDDIRADMNVKMLTAKDDRGTKQADWRDLAESISKRVITPRTIVAENFKKNAIDSPAQQRNSEWLATYITGAVRPESYPSALVATFTSTFLNTLGSQLQKRIMEGLFKATNPADQQGGDYTGTAFAGKRAAEASFAELRKPPIITEANMDFVSEFGSCPERYAGINNCVIDAGFQQAILQYSSSGQGLTVRQAIQEGALHGDWPIYPKDHIANKENGGLDCYRNGYCYRNLVRLRRARVLPVGWEMVTDLCNRDADAVGVNCSNAHPPTLAEVVDNFYNCNENDPRSIFCHLIDPDWVLKAPQTQCLAKVSGPLLEGQGVSARQDVCVDDASCILENDRGECQAFGYCTREKNIWRFGGETCQARFDSCRTYSDSDGNELSVLDKTIDPGVCNASNAGCLWYSSVKKQVSSNLTWSTDRNDRIYLNGQVKECDSEDGGCSRFLRVVPGLGTNLFTNSGFEQNDDLDTKSVDGWSGQLCTQCYSTDSTKSLGGVSSVRPGATGISQVVTILPKHSYVVSVYALNTSITKGKAIIDIDLRKGTTSVKTLTNSFEMGNTTNHDRLTYPFVVDVPLDSIDNAVVTIKQDTSTAAIWFDDVMLEEVSGENFLPSNYADYGSKNIVNLKKAPDYLGCYKDWVSFSTESVCTGNGGEWDSLTSVCNAPTVCKAYAGWCSKDEVGCNLFKPVFGDSPAIAGTPFGDDYCPAECSGYSGFIQQDTYFEKGGNLDFLIPSTAAQCNLEQAGCDEFTNLEAEQSGRAETKEYYSFLRQCKKPDQSCKTFYTWEGSDTEGYQLRTFMLESNGDQPKVTGTQPDTCDEAKFKSQAYPDCRQFYHVDSQGKTHITYASFSRTKVCSDDCTSYRRTLVDGKVECENHGGTWDATQQSCVYLGLPQQSTQCSVQAAGCREYKGNTGNNVRTAFFDDFENGSNDGWRGGQNSNVAIKNFGHSILNKDAATLSKDITSSVNQGNSYTLSFWARSRSKSGATVNVRYSNIVKGQPSIDKALIGSATINDTWKEYTVGPVTLWDSSASNVDGILLHFADVAQNELYIDMVQLREITDRVFLVKNSWNTPISCDNNNISPYGRLGLNNPTRDNPQAQLNCQEYKDKKNVSYFLKSFTRLCRDSAVGCEQLLDTHNSESPFAERYNVLCNAATGTIDSQTNTCTLNMPGDNKFTCKLVNGKDCYVEKTPASAINITCNALNGNIIGTRCTIVDVGSCSLSGGLTSCNIGTVQKVNPSETQVARDSVVYMVNDPEYQCDSDVIGCQEVALPTLDANNQLDTKLSADKQWKSTYLLNQPDTYSNILCNGSELFCKEFNGTDNAKRYFKDPGKRTCEYRTNVKITKNGQTNIATGWFKVDPTSGDAEPCYGNLNINTDPTKNYENHYKIVGSWDVVNEQQYYIVPKSSSDYDGWVGLCPQSENLCTLFVDPRGTADPSKEEKDDISHYFYLKDNKIDTKSCNGQVNPKEGCVLFEDTTNTEMPYHSGATYKRITDTRAEGPINPVDCSGISVADLKSPPSGKEECKDFATYVSVGPGITSPALPPKNDSNTVIKVTRDRTCGEWLSCKSGTKTRDEKGNPVTLCSQLTRCTRYNASSAPSYCKRPVATSFERLTIDYYQKRGGENYTSKKDPIGWTDREFSGYSVPNYFSLDTFVGLSFSDPNFNGGIENRLFHDTRNLDKDTGAFYGVCGDDIDQDGDIDDDCTSVVIDSSTKPPTTAQPVCINRRCILNIDGSKVAKDDKSKGGGINLAALNLRTPEPSCRAYPERESPYPKDVEVRSDLRDNFNGSKICEDCQDTCSYEKYTYGNQAKTKYYQGVPAFKGVCVGGLRDGELCDPFLAKDECQVEKPGGGGLTASGGTCEFQDKKVLTYQGWQGYCLERDYRGVRRQSINTSDYEAPCLTWMPIRYMTGLNNIYDNYNTAGYNKSEEVHQCAEVTLGRDVYTSAVRCSEHGWFSCDNDYNAKSDIYKSAREDIHCPQGHFVVYGGCNSWGNQMPQDSDSGYCTGTPHDRMPYQCVPMGAKHSLGGTLTIKDSKTGGNKFDLEWKKGDSCWDTAQKLADSSPGDETGIETFGRGASKHQAYYAFLTASNIQITTPDYGFAPMRVKEIPHYQDLKTPIGRTLFDDCVLPNVDLLDSAGKVYTELGTEGEFKLMCKTLVQVTAPDESKVKNGKGLVEWLNKAWTDRVAYDATLITDEFNNKVEPFKLGIDGTGLSLTYRTPTAPMSFAPSRYYDRDNVDLTKRAALDPFTGFTNMVTGCKNKAIAPTYFGIGLQKDDTNGGINCGSSKLYNEPIELRKNVTNKEEQNNNQEKIQYLFNEQTAAFYRAEFVYNRYGLAPSTDTCKDDSACQKCIKDFGKRRMECSTDNDCQFKQGNTTLDFGRCLKDPNKPNATGGCELQYFQAAKSQKVKYCGKDVADKFCISLTCDTTNQCTNGGTCENNACTNGIYIDKEPHAVIVGQCKGGGNVCNNDKDCYGTCEVPPAQDTGVGTVSFGEGRCSYSPAPVGEVNITRGNSEQVSDADRTTINTSVERIQQIYARVYEVWRLTAECDGRDAQRQSDDCKTSTYDKLTLNGKTDLNYPSKYPQFVYNKPVWVWDSKSVPPVATQKDKTYKAFMWDVTDGTNPHVIPTPPQFAADTSGGLGESTPGSVSINGNVVTPLSPAVELEEGTPIVLSFYGWADKNQMPLRRVMAAWGQVGAKYPDPKLSSPPDCVKNPNAQGCLSANVDTTPNVLGKYRNRRSLCNVANEQGVDGKGFGGLQNDACEENPFIFEHLYVLRKLVNNNGKKEVQFACEELGGVSKRVVPSNPAFGTGLRRACEFKVEVHMYDNWGWCTGTCENTNKNIKGCYNYKTQEDILGVQKSDTCSPNASGTKAWVDVATVRIFEQLSK